MKKKLAIILCFFMAVGIFANESVESKKNEIQVKMGMFPYFESVFSALVHMNDSGAIIPMPVFTAEYLNYLNSKNGIGASLTIGSPLVSFEASDYNTIYVGASFKYRRIYIETEKIKLYGEVGLGAEILCVTKAEEKFQPFFSASVSPIGIWWGTDDLFGTAELTIGSEGTLATIGIGKRF
jgi:hypothetical protein